YLILMTQKTERWIRPDFGSSLMSYTFMDTGTTMLNMMSRDIAQDLMRQEPRISDVQINIDAASKPGALIIYIGYVVRETNVRDNLVFPFYLDTTWEEPEEAEPVVLE
ncbi:MAG: GPW/gp25 family protein, partial [Anaerotignum sp.]